MKNKVCIYVLVFLFVSPLLASSTYDSEPDSNGYGSFSSVSSGHSKKAVSGPPPPPSPVKRSGTGERAQIDEDQNVPEVDMMVEGLVNAGDRLISNYANAASSLVNRTLGNNKQKKLAADQEMLHDSVAVGDDTVALLEVRDKREWKDFIDKEFNKNPTALVETLLPLAQFNPEDVKELTQYIADKRNAASVRGIIREAANTPYWQAEQEGIEQQAGATSFANSPEARAIKKEFKDHLTTGTKKAAQELWKEGEKKAEQAAENYWNKIRKNLFSK